MTEDKTVVKSNSGEPKLDRKSGRHTERMATEKNKFIRKTEREKKTEEK